MRRRIRVQGGAGPAVVRVAAGGVCLIGARAPWAAPRAGGVRRLRGPRPSDCAHRLAVLLAARYVAQACAIEAGRGGGVRLRAGIEAVHAFTMALAAVRMRRHRAEALAALVIAATVALVDVAPAAGRVVRSRRGRHLRTKGTAT